MTYADRDCPFCAIVNDGAPVDLIAHWPNVWAITPLNPVTPGHVLFIPTVHVEDFTTDPNVSASLMFRAAQWAQGMGGQWNLITSKGKDATQSVLHCHVHLVPRRAGDRLALPWTATDGRGELASFISANGATDRGTLSAPVAPADPTAIPTPSVSVPPVGVRDLMAALQASVQEAKAARDFLTAPFPGPRTGSSAAGSAPPG